MEKKVEAACKKLVIDGLKANKAHDDILTELIVAGVPYGNAKAFFTETGIEAKLLVDPKVLKDAIDGQVTGSDWSSAKTWDDVESFIESIQDELKKDINADVTRGKILAAVRAHCKEKEVKLPVEKKEAKTRAKGGKIATAIVDLFKAKKAPTREDFYKAVRPTVLGHRNTVDNISMHYLTNYAIKNGLTLKEAAEATANFEIPTAKAGIEWATSQKLDISGKDLALLSAK